MTVVVMLSNIRLSCLMQLANAAVRDIEKPTAHPLTLLF
jgi:hypothetical protein